MMMKKTLSLATSTVLATSCALAQPAPPDAPPPPLGPEMHGQMLGGPMRHDMLFVAGMQMEQERVVQGAPYCADAVHETIQQLADGNRIVQKQSSRQCRDGQGRTRQEVAARNGRVNVFLRDPVAKEAWMLDTDRKLAVRIDLPRQPLAAMEPHMIERMKEWSVHFRDQMREKFRMGALAEPATPAVPPVPSTPPEPVRIAMHAGPMHDAMIPPIALHPRLLGPRGPGTTTLLQSDTIEGVRADGKRTVWTLEAGKIGNEKPITIINEVWSSPELGITLRTRDVDPVIGEDSFSVRNVARGEPDAQLFRVPAHFAKVATPDGAMRRK
ncbi:MAG TPA: hypothetical protein VMZ74_10135 [Ramlibacter sp.]|nr:hypothetical protein [Ramlibacter sp.]